MDGHRVPNSFCPERGARVHDSRLAPHELRIEGGWRLAFGPFPETRQDSLSDAQREAFDRWLFDEEGAA